MTTKETSLRDREKFARIFKSNLGPEKYDVNGLEDDVFDWLEQVRADALEEAIVAIQSCQPYQPELESNLLNDAAQRVKELK